MKAILEFDLPEDTEMFNLSTNALNLSIAIREFDNRLRARLKYDNNPEWNDETTEAIRALLWEILAEENITHLLN